MGQARLAQEVGEAEAIEAREASAGRQVAPDHPWLIHGFEAGEGDSSLASLCSASGKMVFIDKLLIKLAADGEKVLMGVAGR